MTETTINYRFVCRRDTAANWVIYGDDLLKAGEWGLELDTGRAKWGAADPTPWRALDYVTLGYIDFTGLAEGSTIRYDSTSGKWKMLNADLTSAIIGATFDAGVGGTIAVGSECDVFVPYGFTILEWRCLANTGVGAFEAEVYVCDYAAYPPASGHLITGTNPMEIPPGDPKAADSVMTGWTKTFAAGGQVVRFKINVASGVQRCLIELIVRKS